MKNRALLTSAAAGALALAACAAAATAISTAPLAAGHHVSVRAAKGAFRAALHANNPTNQPAPHAPQSGARPQVAGSTAAYSTNWSGYVATGAANAFTTVTATWTVPKVTCTAEHSEDFTWVGLDGWTSGTVEQDGSDSGCFEGTAHYYDWYEMYPAGSVAENTVAVGDSLTSTVTRSGTNYTLKVTDNTTPADSFTVTSSCTTCQNNSAEWISERPSYGSVGDSPLAHYPSTTFTGATATKAGTLKNMGGLSPLNNVSMVDATDTYYLATVTGVTGGTKFATTWKNSW